MENNYKKLCPFKRWTLENFPFIEADFDAITNYELLCKVVEYLNKMGSQFNDIIDNIEYLNNWFNNLDVQEEVNNKLDEMVESGELQEIIAQYLNANALWSFDNVQEMKEATNLINGSYAKTLGYHSINDGGTALYKIRQITNDDTVDEMFILSLNDENLVAELIYNIINIKQVGAYGDNVQDDTLIIRNVLENLKETDVVYFPKGSYLCEDDLSINTDNIRIIGDGREISIINFNNNGGLSFSSNQLKLEDIGFTKQNKIELNGYHNSLNKCSIYNGTNGLIVNNGYITQIINCYITHNDGIGIILNNQSFEVIIDDCVIDNNILGIFIIGDSTGAKITNCTIEGNRDKTSNRGCGIAYSTTSTDLHILNNWFEDNGTTNDSVDILSIGLVNDASIANLISDIDSLYTYNKKALSGLIEINGNHFVYTQYSIITSGYKNKFIVENNFFMGTLNKYNKPVLYYTNYQNNEELVCNNNMVVNTTNSTITDQMLSGVKGSYIFTNISITTQNVNKYINGEVILDNKPLFVFEEYISNLSDVTPLYQYRGSGTKYDSGYLNGILTDSYSTDGTNYIVKTKDSNNDFNIFNTTETETSFIVIGNYESIFQCRTDNNVATRISPIKNGLFNITNKQLYQLTGFAIGEKQVIFALIQLNEAEKKASKQCLAFKALDYYPTIYN